MAAHERMGLVEGFHPLAGADGDDFSESAFADDGFDLRVERRVSQHETKDDAAAKSAGQGVEFLTAFDRLRRRFFEQEIISQVQRGAGVFEVVGILGRDDEHIGKFSCLEKRGSSIESANLPGGSECGDLLAPAVNQIRRCGDFIASRHACGDACIGPATGTTTEDGKAKGRIHERKRKQKSDDSAG